MKALEEIAEAVVKLVRLKAESTPGSWFVHQNILGVTRVRVVDTVVAETYGENLDHEEVNAELIVALQHTIDAQLVLLEWARGLYALPNGKHPSPLEKRVLSLARAINGVES